VSRPSTDQLHRRDVFRILGVTIAAETLDAQHLHDGKEAKTSGKAYKPRFFSTLEYQIVDELAELLIPADNDSPGARQARVAWFIDTVLLYSDPSRQGNWRKGIAAINEQAQSRFGKGVQNCTLAQCTDIMEALAQNEGTPQTPLDHFFAEFKSIVIEAFCVSEVGMKEYFRYQGNTELSEFPGCRPGEIAG
jgi:Gluconate 2-dehydrogenase subunit 3